MSLTTRQARFVVEYLLDLNATQAAVRAGYSIRTARSIGHENLTKPDIAAKIQEGFRELQERAQLEADSLLAEIDRLAMANLADFLETDEDGYPRVKRLEEITREQLATIAEFHLTTTGIKIKQHSKIRALELALKRRGFTSSDEVIIRIERG